MRMNRRTLVKGGLTGGTFAIIGIRAGYGQTPDASPESGWTFTDDRGITVSLPSVPTRVIAQTVSAASLWDFGFHVVGVYGDVYTDDGTTPDPQLGNVDVTQVANLGEWGTDLDTEKVVELGAQVYVDVDRGGGLWGITPEVEALLLEIVQTVGIATTVSYKTATERFEQLAVSLGIDSSAPELVTARQATSGAETALAEVARSKPGLKVLVLTGDPTTNAYFVSPEAAGDLMYYKSLGVDIVVPENPSPENLNVFEAASWEQVGKYPADVILFDSRFDVTTLDSDALWSALPAVQAGQVGTWDSVFPLSWQGLTGALENLTSTLAEAEIILE
jgi:iron complex transport system substrate-binding protein